jgi:hypothetical protein
MALTSAGIPQARCNNFWKFLLLALPLSGASLAGCSACFRFASSPSTGTVNVVTGDTKPTCMLTKANGAVRVVARATSACGSCAGSHQIRHLLVTLRGIDLHPGTVADDASPDWQELMPQLRSHPLQLDLTSAAAGAGQESPLLLAEAVSLPAGTYRQLRLRLLANQLVSDDALPEKNACGPAAFNCVVLEDARIQPLLLEGPTPQLRIKSPSIARGFFLIPPDSNCDLTIDFSVSWSLSSSADEGIRLLPALTVSSAALDSRTPAQ